jgi:hypothetical protein
LVLGDERQEVGDVPGIEGDDHEIVVQASALTLVMRSARLAGMTS